MVLEEIKRSEDSPGHVLGDLSFNESLPAPPLPRPILGPPENVASFDRDQGAGGFFERWYTAPTTSPWWRPATSMPAQLAAQISPKLFERCRAAGGAKRRERPKSSRAKSATAGTPWCCERPFEGAAHRPHLAGRSLPRGRRRHLPRPALAFLLGECESSRLVRDCASARGWWIASTPPPIRRSTRGSSALGLETDEARSRATPSRRCVEEVERLRREPVSQDELERARANFLASEHFERESVSGMASKLASFQVLGGRLAAAKPQYFETAAPAPARDDLLRVAQQYLEPGQDHGRAPPGPDSRSAKSETLDESAILDAIAESVGAGVARAREGDAAKPAVAALPPTGTPTRLACPTVSARRAAVRNGAHEISQTYTLRWRRRASRGFRDRKIPVVAARAAFSGGLLAEDESSAGLAASSVSMWLRGTRHRSAADYARDVEDIAAEIDGFSGRNSVGLSLEVTRDT